jgi:hypothetical protein
VDVDWRRVWCLGFTVGILLVRISCVIQLRFQLAMPRFSVNDLLLGSTLIAFGTAMLTFGSEMPGEVGVDGLYTCGCIFVGAGVFVPFQYPWIGAAVGVIVSMVLLH